MGPVRTQTGWLGELLANPRVTALNVVTTPEEMPVVETIELVAKVRAELDVPLGAVLVNRVLPELFTRADVEAFEAMREPAALGALTKAAGAGVESVLEAAELAVNLRRTRASHLDELRARVDLPLLYLPELFVRLHGLRVTRMVAEALGQELGL
jgi:anion-transporting  ArsA/GET3 family ATPase